MTSEDVRSKLERKPFGPVRPHLVSSKTVEARDGHEWIEYDAIAKLEPKKSRRKRAS